jgi:hypothetical protein
MDHFYINTKYLLTGQSAPFTGEFVNVAKARNACFTVFSSGNGSVSLEYKSPFFQNQGVSFYSFAGLSTGHATPVYLTTPIEEVRAIANGTGNFWVAATIQN